MAKNTGELRIHESVDELRTDLADYVAELSEASVKERGVFAIALSGGSLIGLMGKLCEAPYNKTVDWSKWYIFWADERVVAKNHADSNYKLAKDGLLSKVPIIPSHVHSINDSVSAEEAADDYEFVIRQLVKTRVVSVSEISDCPKFDLILLGLGSDGHVASLFPNHSALNEREEWVTFITDSPKPPPERITFTLPVINSASNVAVVVTGESKAADLLYTRYRWHPLACNLLRFNGLDFLEKMRGKSIMFVGDSLSRNQWQSLTCLLHSAVPNSPYTLDRVGDVSIFTLTEYRVKVMLDRNVYLVDVVREDIGRVLKLDSIQGSKLWQGIDMLIFNTWHWWYRRGPTQPWDFVELGGHTYKDIDRMRAFEIALKTWGAWVDANVDPTRVKVFFQGISPSHYNGSLWNEPSATSCIRQKTPVPGSTYPGGLPPAVAVLKSVLSTIRKPVTLLDITTLSLLRKDGHPSIYGLNGAAGMDCSHWCLPGVPDTWNEILYNLI